MKHMQNIFLLIALLGVFSCTCEELPGGDTDNKGLRLMITADDITQAKTRATTEEGTEDERSYSELHLYCFKADGTPLHHTVVNTAGVYPYFLSLPAVIETAGAVDYYVFASPVGTTMPGANATVNELTALLTDGMAGGNPLAIQYTADRKIPMSGSVIGHDFSNQISLTIPLTRTVSKLRVRIASKIDAAAGITLYPEEIQMQVKNLRSRVGYFSSNANPSAPALFDSQWLTMADNKETANTYNWVYGYINEHLFDEAATLPADRGVLILTVPFTKGAEPKSTYTYEVPMDFQFKRNFIYQLTVDVYGPGKEDLKVNIDVLPWNVEDKEFDSETSFTLSNEEFVAYTNADANTELTVASVSSFGKAAGTVTASSGITVTTASFPAYTKATDIKIKMSAATTSGTVTVTQDGVSKTINVNLKQQLLVWDEEIASYAKSDYTSIDVIAANDFKVATAKSNYANAQSLTAGDKVNSIDGFYFYTDGTQIPANAPSALFIVQDKEGKSTRVLLRRDKDYVYAQLSDYYVGTFHRHTQTGERIIQRATPATGEENAQWGAKAVSGGDWIVLDGNAASIAWPNGTVDAETKQLPATATNTIASHKGLYKFRLGLKSANPNTPETGYLIGKPRYGLVLVGYQNAAGVNNYHKIYVRQGEDADYVLEGEGALKWSPYNLVANGYTTENTSSAWDITSISFADYPSRMGSRFTATNAGAAYSFSKCITGFLVEGNVTEQAKVYAHCPGTAGYRVPGTGMGNGTAIPSDDNGSVLNGTGLVKSLFKSPAGYSYAWRWSPANSFAWEIYDTPASPWNGGVQNRLDGYYADGMIDRLSLTSLTSGCLLYNNAYYAPKAAMYYNPTTGAHITFPINSDESMGDYSLRAGSISAADGNTTPALSFRWGWFNPMYSARVTVHYTVPERGTQLIRCVKD